MYQSVLSRFHGVCPARRPGTWKALCPTHPDRRPSVTLWVGRNGNLLARCWANRGCTWPGIVAAVGLPLSEWFRDNRSQAMRAIVETYDYLDELRKLLYQVVRFDPKDFRQRRPDGKGGWVWNLDGVRRVLYRLPELCEADPRRMVLVAEGEKDVNNLMKLGFVATTNAGGAGKWLTDYSRALTGRHVCLLPDTDAPGLAHSAMVAGSLMTHGAATLRTVQLPGAKDVSEWLASGGTEAELKRLIRQAEVWMHSKRLVG